MEPAELEPSLGGGSEPDIVEPDQAPVQTGIPKVADERVEGPVSVAGVVERASASDKTTLPVSEPAFDPEVVDEELVQAVKSYQETHQFRPNGEPTPGFWKSLNIPAEERVAQIELSLQRWRESRYEGEPDFVMVNIPDFHAEVYRHGKRQLRFRVVTGNTRRYCDRKSGTWVYPNATPVQEASFKHMIVNPHWYVPDRIAREDILPQAKRDASYLARNHYEMFKGQGGREIIRQKPGPDNALGLVKFIFPNPHNTFMHDTPKKKYFEYPVRAFSHGCIRVGEPLKLAKYLVEHHTEGPSVSIDALVDEGRTKLIDIEDELPVFVEYYTTRTDDQGRVNFLSDIYRRDQARQLGQDNDVLPCTPKRRPVKIEEETEPTDDEPADTTEDVGP